MTPFAYANEAILYFTLIAYLLAAFAGTVCLAMSVYYKLKIIYVLPEVVVSATSLLLFCGFYGSIDIRFFGADPNDFVGSPCFMPTWSVILIVLLLLALVSACLVLVVKKRLSGITAMSVKEAINALSSGLCFYDESGRVLLLNFRIDRECREITGEPLYDGKAFWENMCGGKAAEGVNLYQSGGSVIAERADGSATCYKRIAHEAGGKTVYEISGTDITEELVLKKETEKKNENLHEMNIRLRKYGETVAEVTRERETLAARVKVHSNLGSLILRTKKSLLQGDYDRKSLISAWNDVTKLICVFEDSDDDKFSEAEKTAASVDVKIFYDGIRPKKSTVAEKIFAGALFECVVNTARHANGTELYVSYIESEKAYTVTFKNNGEPPTGEIKEGGGLSSLRTMTENAGGQMTVKGSPQFSLSITIPKETENNER